MRNAREREKPMLGSRLQWKINNWQCPQVEREDAQTDNPNDHSADGADMMAMLRYLVMAYWEGNRAFRRREKNGEVERRKWGRLTTPSLQLFC